MGRVQTARHDGLLRRLFSIKGGGSLLAETLGDAFPVIPLEGGPIELLKLAGWELGIAGLSTTSPVAQTVGGQLFNPPNSGKLVIPTTVWFSSPNAGRVFLGVTDVALATAATGRHRDTREGLVARTTGIVRHGNAPAVPTNAARFQILADETFILEDSDGLAVLAPGTGLTIVSVVTNITLHSGWLWRERIAEPSELLF